jgi:hypothetical protein
MQYFTDSDFSSLAAVIFKVVITTMIADALVSFRETMQTA